MFDSSQVPNQEAFRFQASRPTKFEFDSNVKPGSSRKFSGTGYSGDVIPGHWYWGNVIFALDSIETIGRIPALIDHDRGLRAGFVEASDIQDATGVTFSGSLLSNEAGQTVAKDSDEGFPWQMSLHIEPSSIEQVDPGTNVVVNGRNLVGPLTIFRNSKVIEVSFTATGQDSNTSAKAFSRSTSTIQNTGDSSMTPEQIKALQDRAAALETENVQFKKTTEALSAEVDAIKKTAAEAEASRRETELKTLFGAVKKELSAEKLAAYQAMPATTFSVVFGDLKESMKAPSVTRASLFSHTQAPKDESSGGSDAGKQSSSLVESAKKRFAK